MNFEGGYYLTDNLSVGGFLTYHSNHKYIPRETISLPENGSLNTDQQHTLFQLPFGVSGRYTMNREGMFQPYFGLKLGPQYGKLKTVFNAFQETTDTWGFYMSPEIGVNIFPWVYRPGIHVAAYYSYATNKGKLMNNHVDGMSNFGLRLGIGF
jgi:outer membrane protein W